MAEAWAPILDSGTALIKVGNNVKASDAVGTTSTLLPQESAPPKVLLLATCLANIASTKTPEATAMADAVSLASASNMNDVTKLTTSRAAAVDSSSSVALIIAAEGREHSISAPLTADAESSVTKQDLKEVCLPSA